MTCLKVCSMYSPVSQRDNTLWHYLQVLLGGPHYSCIDAISPDGARLPIPWAHNHLLHSSSHPLAPSLQQIDLAIKTSMLHQWHVAISTAHSRFVASQTKLCQHLHYLKRCDVSVTDGCAVYRMRRREGIDWWGSSKHQRVSAFQSTSLRKTPPWYWVASY